MDNDDLRRLLVEHTDAWNSHDIDRLMGLFGDDCVFDASGGTETHGQRFVGRADVRSAGLRRAVVLCSSQRRLSKALLTRSALTALRDATASTR